ncbi:ethanolamine utilization protein EutH [Facklamia lactis]|uniref:ethanolamine utilization protein EutH n=1 Tax=Facklamia lactis TaxID=2749967 RepID=UPI0018CEADFB|nr:ethanolamine utilization protein EutH [Facklamia lactis]MBG9979490.1 ethanolamine utilization protein EutH [Facklamia lactis]
MGINEIIMWIIAIFMILGAIDYVLDNKFGLGEQFSEGIMAMGALFLSMAGIIVVAPLLSQILSPIIVPLFRLVGADPAMFAGTILANDMGAYFLAQSMTENPEIVAFSGLTLGSMMGATIVFSIPVSLGIIEKEDQEYLATGILCGMMAVPFGAFAGGLMSGMNVMSVLINLIPIIIVAVLIGLGMWLMPQKMISGFKVFGKGVVIVAIIGLIIGGLELLTGIKLVENVAPISEGFMTVGPIAITLAGAYGLVFVITKAFKKPLMKFGGLLGMNDVAAAGLIASLANNIAMFQTMKNMDKRGKIINVAFAVCASFTFGDHLGFTAGIDTNAIVPMFVSKLIGGIIGVIIALMIVNKMYPRKDQALMVAE